MGGEKSFYLSHLSGMTYRNLTLPTFYSQNQVYNDPTMFELGPALIQRSGTSPTLKFDIDCQSLEEADRTSHNLPTRSYFIPQG